MNISRNFLLIGSLYLLIGMGLGMYMGAHQDFTLAPLHAHINLVGFTLMTLFGIAYRVVPALAGSRLAPPHFWLFQIGALLMLIALFLLLSGRMSGPSVGPYLGAFEGVTFLGALCFAVNIFRNA